MGTPVYKLYKYVPVIVPLLQSIYVTRDRVILKFEAAVGCEIQNSSGNIVSFSKINRCEISF